MLWTELSAELALCTWCMGVVIDSKGPGHGEAGATMVGVTMIIRSRCRDDSL